LTAKLIYTFTADIWLYGENGRWHFVSVPADQAKEIRQFNKDLEEGWGRLKATAIANDHEWKTAIWFDKKKNTYLLPIKADIRKRFSLKEGDQIKVSILI
tara:strand:- start:54467 stop:54766 length:300 start_codon:yes stop_codon:yes gene_type:complete